MTFDGQVLARLRGGFFHVKLTFIATDATPDDEREFGVEGEEQRSRKFLAA